MPRKMPKVGMHDDYMLVCKMFEGGYVVYLRLREGSATRFKGASFVAFDARGTILDSLQINEVSPELVQAGTHTLPPTHPIVFRVAAKADTMYGYYRP